MCFETNEKQPEAIVAQLASEHDLPTLAKVLEALEKAVRRLSIAKVLASDK